jgi:hypothetical protein
VYSLGPSNMLRISFTLRQNLMTLQTGDSRSKMAGAGFHSIANSRALIPRFTTIRITAWQSALNFTADCQLPLSGLKRTLKAVQAFGIPLSNLDL